MFFFPLLDGDVDVVVGGIVVVVVEVVEVVEVVVVVVVVVVVGGATSAPAYLVYPFSKLNTYVVRFQDQAEGAWLTLQLLAK